MKWRYVSPSSFAVLGWTPEEMIQMEAFALIYPEDLPGLMAIAIRNFAPGVEPERASRFQTVCKRNSRWRLGRKNFLCGLIF
jgi:hypothetical protein